MAATVARSLTQPFVNFGKWYAATAERAPFRTALWTSLLKTSAADMFAQKVIEKKEEMDLRRHAVFCIFGFAYLVSEIARLSTQREITCILR